MSENEYRDQVEKTKAEKEQARREVRDLYRRVYNTPIGKKVLCHMLVELGFFNTSPASEGAVALQNYGKRILNHMGIWDASQAENIVNQMMSLPLK
jgi:hypothetical protein